MIVCGNEDVTPFVNCYVFCVIRRFLLLSCSIDWAIVIDLMSISISIRSSFDVSGHSGYIREQLPLPAWDDHLNDDMICLGCLSLSKSVYRSNERVCLWRNGHMHYGCQRSVRSHEWSIVGRSCFWHRHGFEIWGLGERACFGRCGVSGSWKCFVSVWTRTIGR
jgi:hypothetical protein